VRFVIADDEPLVRAYLRSLIVESRAAEDPEPPLEARDGAELADILRRGEADAAFVDIRMPRMDGLEAMRMLRSEGIEKPWYVLSSHSDFAYAKAALELGAAGYALKPPAPEEIAEAVKVLRAASERERAAREEAFVRDWTYFSAEISEAPPALPAGDAAMVGLLATDPVRSAAEFAPRSEAACRAFRDRARRYAAALSAAAAAPTRKPGRIAVAASVRGAGNPTEADAAARRFLNEAFMAAGNAAASGAGNRSVLIVERCGASLGSARAVLSELERVAAFRPLLPSGALERSRTGDLLAAFSGPELAAAAAASALADALAAGDRLSLRKAAEDLAVRMEAGPLGERAQRAVRRFVESVLPGAPADGKLDREALAEACGRVASGARGTVPEGDTIDSVIAYLEQRFQERLSVASVARTFGLTPNYLSSLFHRRVGETFVERITALRLDKARELLRAGKRVKETAWAVGYGNERHFSRLYRDRFGVPPAEEKRNGGQAGTGFRAKS
jgi:two-component system response regulator YesN